MSNNLIEITSLEQINQLKKDNKYLVLDFFSPSCAPCMRIKPAIEELASLNKNNISFGIINIKDNPEIKEEYDIKKIPSFVYIKEQEIVEKYTGFNLDEIKNNLNKYKEKLSIDSDF